MKKIIATIVAFMPSMAFAQAPATTRVITDVNSLTAKLQGIGNVVIGILISLAVIYIIYNTLMFIMKAGTDDAAAHRSGILWGIVGLAVILSIWGLVAILTGTFVTDNARPEYPIVDLPPTVL